MIAFISLPNPFDKVTNAINGMLGFAKNEISSIPNSFINGIKDTIFNLIADAIYDFVQDIFINEICKYLYNYFIEYLKSPDGIIDTSLVATVAAVVTPIAISLLGLFFVVDFCKRAAYLETMTVENVIKPIFMLIIGKVFVDKSVWILAQISYINMNMISSISHMVTGNNILFTLGNCPQNGFGKIILALFYAAICFVIMICLIIMITKLAKRKIELSILSMISPIFFATISSGVTMDTFKSFIKHYIVVCFETFVITVGLCVIKNAFEAFSLVATDANMKSSFICLLEVMSATFFVMGSRQLLSGIIGGGGSSGGGIISPLTSLLR